MFRTDEPPADRFPLPKEAWYIGAASSQLGTEPLAVMIHDQPIALFRHAAGGVSAIHDRCPHRGVALSLGAVEDDTLACPYHGWRFAGDGGCRLIPSLRPDQNIKDVAVRSYPVVEQDGYVWVWMGAGDAMAGPDLIEDFAAFSWLQGAIDLACEAILPIENNLDICHAAFTHPNQHPQWFRVQALGLQRHDYDIEACARRVTVKGPGVLLQYTAPDRVVVGGGEAFRIILHHVPTQAGHCRQHWLLQRERVDVPLAPVWSDREPEILAQDRRILESAQRNCHIGDADVERSVEADAPGLAVRRLLSVPDKTSSQGSRPRRITILS